MKHKQIYFEAVIVVLVLVIIWNYYAMLNVAKTEVSKTISVIVSDSSSDRWISLRAGIEQAAGDYNLELNYVSTGKMTGEEEAGVFERERSSGADGIVLQPVSDTFPIPDEAEVILLESDVTEESGYETAAPDNFEMGKSLGQAASFLDGKKAGILCGNQQQLAMRQRLEGLLEILEKSNVDISWTMESSLSDEDALIQNLEAESEVDILFALGNEETETAVDYLLKKKDRQQECLLYGVGCSEKVVYYLDKGLIQTLVVPNEFYMGYQSVKKLAEQLENHKTEKSSVSVDYLVVDKEHLYDSEIEKILFPIVQ